MPVTVTVYQQGERQSYTFDDAPESRRAALALRDEAERQRRFVAWIDTRDERCPQGVPHDGK